VDRVQQLGGATNFYDGLFSACLDQFPRRKERQVTQPVLVLFSDGQDTGSLHRMPDVIAMAQRGEIQIFALSVRGNSMPAPGDVVLQRLADETGARLYLANSDNELSAIFSAMVQQMRTQYPISFQPQEPTPIL
jgi:hypothetical protein